ERFRQCVAIELWIVAGPGNREHVDQAGHAVRLQQFDQFVDRPRGMAHGQNHMLHGPIFAASRMEVRSHAMLEITWLGHGTFHVRLDTGEVLLMDPWTEGNLAYPAEHKIEQVIPMHFGTFPPLVGRPEQLAELIQDLPTKVLELEPGKPVRW